MDTGALKMSAKRPAQNKQLALHVSPTLIEAVDTGAERQCRSRSELIRQTILKELEACSVPPVAA